MEPIGFIRTPFPEKFGIPRQPGLAPSAVGNLTLEPQFQKEGVFDGLEEADFLWLVFYFHQQKGEWKPKIRPPRAGGITSVVFLPHAVPTDQIPSACRW